MAEFTQYINENSQWLWFILGILLLVGEMIIPGVFLLWLGLAAMVAGLASLFLPDIGFIGEGLVFAGLSAVFIYAANRFFYGETGEPVDNKLNARASGYVGQSFKVARAIENGRGQVRVGDTLWLASGPDCGEGTTVKVVDADGALLIVEPAGAD